MPTEKVVVGENGYIRIKDGKACDFIDASGLTETSESYWRICPHPDGGFAAIMGTAGQPAPIPRRQAVRFITVAMAYSYAYEMNGNTRHGILFDPGLRPVLAFPDGSHCEARSL
jgi:hypothetical protein